MVKVLNIISDTQVGGAGRVLVNYLRYRDREKFDVSAAVPKGSILKERLEACDVPVYEVDIEGDRSLDMKAVKPLKKLIREVDPDIVHTHGSMTGRIAGKQCGKKVVYTRHSVFPVSPRLRSGPGRLVNKWVNEHYMDKAIAVSPAAMENLTDSGISEKYIEVVLNGVEPVVRKDPETCAAVRRRYGIEDGCFTAGIMARFENYKGHLDILSAAEILRDRGRTFKIIMAGTGQFEDTVKQQAEERGLMGQIVFAGFVTDVSEILSILDAQLNASYGTEATSLALLEGFSAGVPAVVSDYGGNPWVVEDGKNGRLFKTRDSRALADCLDELMQNGALLDELRAGAREIYEQRFTGQIFAKNTERIYTEMLEGNKNGE